MEKVKYGCYMKITTDDVIVYINNTDIKEMTIKNEDNGKPIILVESKQQ